MKKTIIVGAILAWSLFLGWGVVRVAQAEPAPPSLITLQTTLDDGLANAQIMSFLHRYLSYLLTQAQLREQALVSYTSTPRYLKFMKKVLTNYHLRSQPFYHQSQQKPFITEAFYTSLDAQLDQLLLSI